MGEQRASNRDVVVSCERPHDPGWGSVDRSESTAQTNEGGPFRVLHEPAQDVVEESDPRGGMASGFAHKQIRDGPEQLGQRSTCVALERELEIANSLHRPGHLHLLHGRKKAATLGFDWRSHMAKSPSEFLLTPIKLKRG